MNSELLRIGQSRLILIDELVDSMISLIRKGYDERDNKNSEIIRIDITDDKLWIERM